MYLVAFSLRLTVSCSKGFNFINALSKIFPFSASSVTDSLPFAGFYNSLADFFIFTSFIPAVSRCHTWSWSLQLRYCPLIVFPVLMWACSSNYYILFCLFYLKYSVKVEKCTHTRSLILWDTVISPPWPDHTWCPQSPTDATILWWIKDVN